jgi:S1-C subfamily serine protease
MVFRVRKVQSASFLVFGALVAGAACTPPAQAPTAASCDEAAVRSELRAHAFLRYGERRAGHGQNIAAYAAEVRERVHRDRASLCGDVASDECAALAALEADLAEADGANAEALKAWGAGEKVLVAVRDALRQGCGHGERTDRCAEAEQLRAAIGDEGERESVERLTRLDAFLASRNGATSFGALCTQARQALVGQVAADNQLASIETAVAGRIPQPPEEALTGRCTRAWAGTWTGEETPDPRALTVSIAVDGGPARGGLLRRLSPYLGTPASNEWIGSGFVVAGRGTAGASPVVVTNRHVVEGGATFALTDGHGTSLGRAHAIYIDPDFDLAVLAPETPLDRGGARLSDAPLPDLASVVAVGFPGLGGRASYQITTGKVSNGDVTESFGGRTLHYVQHTAAIDPGNSGGPLLDERGLLVGVNTLKATSRENAGFAIPREALAEATAHAYWDDPAPPSDPALLQEALRVACLDIVATVGHDTWRRRHDRIAEDAMVPLGYIGLDRFGEFVRLRGLEEARAFETVAYLGLSASLNDSGGVAPEETCTGVARAGGTVAAPTVTIATLTAPRTLTFRWERGHYLLTGLSPAPSKEAAKLGGGK